MLFSTESRRLVFTEPTTMKSLLTRGGYDPINIGPSRMFARPSKFLEFERIRFRLSALQVIRMRHSKLREYGFSSRLLKWYGSDIQSYSTYCFGSRSCKPCRYGSCIQCGYAYKCGTHADTIHVSDTSMHTNTPWAVNVTHMAWARHLDDTVLAFKDVSDAAHVDMATATQRCHTCIYGHDYIRCDTCITCVQLGYCNQINRKKMMIRIITNQNFIPVIIPSI